MRVFLANVIFFRLLFALGFLCTCAQACACPLAWHAAIVLRIGLALLADCQTDKIDDWQFDKFDGLSWVVSWLESLPGQVIVVQRNYGSSR